MLTFRIDDVSSNTDFPKLRKMIKHLKDNFVCEVWAGVSLFSHQAFEGSVYPNPPFKGNPTEHFYNVNQYLKTDRLDVAGARLVSHGLFHADHSVLDYGAQEMSILASCHALKADIFIPPFNRFNKDTEKICTTNLIRLIRSQDEGWKSLEFEAFSIKSDNWYFHPWRFTFEEFKHALSGKLENVSAQSL